MHFLLFPISAKQPKSTAQLLFPSLPYLQPLSRVTDYCTHTRGQGLAPVTSSRASGLRWLLLGHHCCCQAPIPICLRRRSHMQKVQIQKSSMECIYLKTIVCLDGKSVFYINHVVVINVFQNTQR